MRTSSRNLALLLFDEVELLDVAGALQVFTTVGRQWNWRPFRVLPLGEEARLYETRNQLRVEARFTFDDCPEPELIFVPGGYGARRRDNDRLVEWLSAHAPAAELLLAVGNGALLLARAGLLGEQTIAIPDTALDDLLDIEPHVRTNGDDRVVESGKIITARSSAASHDVALTAVTKLLGAKQAQGAARELAYPWGPDAGGPDTVKIEIKS